MPKYALHYFGLRARGEIIRLLLTVAGQEFEDHRFSLEEWPSIKGGMPAGQVPVLEVDGKQMNQSIAIARYLAREYGFAGKTNLEQYYVDRIMDTVGELYTKDRTLYLVLADQKEEREALEKTTFAEDVPKFLDLFVKFLDEGSDGGLYFVGKSLTMADLAVHDILTTFLQKDKSMLDKYPKLQANRKEVESNSKLAHYLKQRPETVL